MLGRGGSFGGRGRGKCRCRLDCVVGVLFVIGEMHRVGISRRLFGFV